VKLAALLGVGAVTALVLAIVFLLPPSEISGSVGQNALAGVLVAWPVYLAVMGVALGAYSRQAFLGIASATAGNRARKTGARGGNAVTGAAVWQRLKTEFGAAVAVAIIIETVALGISLGMAFKLGLLNRFVIWAVLATGVPLAWMIAGKSGASAGGKGLVKVGVAALVAMAVLGTFNWAVLSALGWLPSSVWYNLDRTRNYLNRGGDPNAKYAKRSLLILAFEYPNMEVAKLLIASGSNVNGRDYFLVPGIYSRVIIVPILRETALHKAVKKRNIEGADLLISKGADINAKDGARNQITPLHLAVQNRDKLMVELLVAKGADVRARDTTGNTPLRIAEKNGYTEIVELLRRGATK
jgi:hypothetical protein